MMPDDLLKEIPGEGGNGVLGALAMGLLWLLTFIVKTVVRMMPGRGGTAVIGEDEPTGRQAELSRRLREDIAYLQKHVERLEESQRDLAREVKHMREHPDFRVITLEGNKD